MINQQSLDLASISWGVLLIIFLLLIIAGKIRIKNDKRS